MSFEAPGRAPSSRGRAGAEGLLCGGRNARKETALRPLECGGVAAAAAPPGAQRGARAGPGRRAGRRAS